MALITFAGLWLHDNADRSDFTVLRYDVAASSFSINGDVRLMANGRKVIVTRPGKNKSVSYPIPYLEEHQVGWLEEHAGRLILARDSRRRKMFGTYFTADSTDRRVFGALCWIVSTAADWWTLSWLMSS